MDKQDGLVEVGALPPLLAPLYMELMLEGAGRQKKKKRGEDRERSRGGKGEQGVEGKS